MLIENVMTTLKKTTQNNVVTTQVSFSDQNLSVLRRRRRRCEKLPTRVSNLLLPITFDILASPDTFVFSNQ